jgi:hypothetical protein
MKYRTPTLDSSRGRDADLPPAISGCVLDDTQGVGSNLRVPFSGCVLDSTAFDTDHTEGDGGDFVL